MEEWNLLTDDKLIHIIVRDKNSSAYGALYDRYKNKVLGRCFTFVKNRDEAEDLTHDIFLLAYVKLNTFKGESKFSSWLYSITYNYCINYVRRNTADELYTEKIIEDEAGETDQEPSDEELFNISIENLKKALEMIPPDDKKILLLKYQDDVKIKELEVLLELHSSAVKMRLKRAKIRLRDVYLKLSKNEKEPV